MAYDNVSDMLRDMGDHEAADIVDSHKACHDAIAQQAKQIAELKAQVAELREDLLEAVMYLKQGKARFAPHTTNSLVDSFIARAEAKEKDGE